MLHKAKTLSGIVLVLGWLVAITPAHAISGASIHFDETGASYGLACTANDLPYSFSVTGSTDDGNGVDWFAVMELDGDLTVQDNDFYTVPVGQTLNISTMTEFGSVAGAVVDTRPIHVRVIDIPDATGVPEDQAAGVALTSAGTVLASDLFDIATVNPDCAALPDLTGVVVEDDRINPENHAPVAIYCSADGDLVVFKIISATEGVPAFIVTADKLEAARNNRTIARGMGITLSKADDGYLQVFASQTDGKGYMFVWDACPLTDGASLIIDNGVVSTVYSY